jgi:hypothetical protein
MQYAKYFLQHMDYLLLQQIDPLKKADFFSVIFNEVPTYAEIASVTRDGTELTGINELFKLKNNSVSSLVHYAELFLHEIRDELARWRIILAVPYREYLSSK